MKNPRNKALEKQRIYIRVVTMQIMITAISNHNYFEYGQIILPKEFSVLVACLRFSIIGFLVQNAHPYAQFNKKKTFRRTV